MVFDSTYFGYGAGLVMAGWCLGMVYSLAVGVIHKVRG